MHRPGRDIPWKQFFKQLAAEYKKDRIGDQAAALTYYGVLAVFPFLIFLVTIGGLLLNPERIASLVDQLGKAAPSQVAGIIGGRLHQLEQQAGGGILTIAIVGALWAASGGVTSLMNALNRAYDVRETRPFWKVRPIAIGVTLVATVIAVVIAAVMVSIPAITHFFPGVLAWILGILRYVVAGFLMMLLLAILYWALPNVHGRFQIITFGAVVTVPLWLIASFGFALYVRYFGKYGAVYGSLAGVIVFLVWMWISSQIVLLGAEMNKLLTPRRTLQESPTGEKRAGEEPSVAPTRGPEPQPT